MTEIIVPCPNCRASLLVDEQNAGRDVLCPGCQVRLTLPAELNEGVQAVAAGAADAGAVPAKKNHPLLRSGHLAALPEDPEGPPQAAQHRATHLPERRGLSPEEEMRRHAALTAEPAAYDLHNVDTKGRTAFPCPGCHRPVWITDAEWGEAVVCEGCAREIVAPDPGKNAPARLVQPDDTENRPRTVLPERRQVENLPLGENAAAGRPRRQGGQFPPAREPAPHPPAHLEDRAKTRVGGIEPIPARGDIEISAVARKGPPAAKRNQVARSGQKAAAREFGHDTVAAEAYPGETPRAARVHHRINPERAPTFTPKHEADLSVEEMARWGGETPQENTPVFRRTLTLAVIILFVAAIGVTAFLLRSYFSPADHGAEAGESANEVKNVHLAKELLERFFSAKTVEEMAKEVRHPELTLVRMKNYYAAGVPRHRLQFTKDWRDIDNYADKGVDFVFTTIHLEDKVKDYEVALEVPKDGGPLKLDWENFVAWSDTSWIEFLKSTSTRPSDFRVEVTPTDYYNYHYSDSSRYLAFKVNDRDNSEYCYAYCEANTPLGNLLLKKIREARQEGISVRTDPATGETQGVARVILRLRYLPEGQPHNQAIIDALVWNDWLEP